MFCAYHCKNNLLCTDENSGLEVCCNTYLCIRDVHNMCVQEAVVRVVKGVGAVAVRAVLYHKQ
jgi:hypothetical protein